MKILVVRFKQIGDAILSSVICKTLRENFPDAQIDYVLYDHVAPLFENQNYINNVIKITKEERKNPFKYLKKVWNVTRENYDIVIDIMSTPKSEVFTLLSRKAKYKIGRWKKNRGYTYTHKIPEPVGMDKCDKFLKMLEPLKKDYPNLMLDKNYSFDFSEEEKNEVRELMIKSGVDFKKILIPVAINSRRPEKVYPIDYMKEIVKGLITEYDCQVILYYSPDEEEFAKNFHKELENDSRIISSIKTKSIRQLGVLFTFCDMFVGNEGGPRHLAQAVDLLSFAIFSPRSSKKDWLSFNNERHEGIEPIDIGAENFDELTYEEKYRLIKPNMILEKVREKMKLINKK